MSFFLNMAIMAGNLNMDGFQAPAYVRVIIGWVTAIGTGIAAAMLIMDVIGIITNLWAEELDLARHKKRIPKLIGAVIIMAILSSFCFYFYKFFGGFYAGQL